VSCDFRRWTGGETWRTSDGHWSRNWRHTTLRLNYDCTDCTSARFLTTWASLSFRVRNLGRARRWIRNGARIQGFRYVGTILKRSGETDRSSRLVGFRNGNAPLVPRQRRSKRRDAARHYFPRCTIVSSGMENAALKGAKNCLSLAIAGMQIIGCTFRGRNYFWSDITYPPFCNSRARARMLLRGELPACNLIVNCFGAKSSPLTSPSSTARVRRVRRGEAAERERQRKREREGRREGTTMWDGERKKRGRGGGTQTPRSHEERTGGWMWMQLFNWGNSTGGMYRQNC